MRRVRASKTVLRGEHTAVVRPWLLCAFVVFALVAEPSGQALGATLIRSERSGRWSEPATWPSGQLPKPGDRVQIRAGHRVVFDVKIDEAIRSLHIAGTLAFDPDRDTVLTAGLIKIQPGDDPSETGLDTETDHATGDAALEVGTADAPIRAEKTATIRLAVVPGLDPDATPALVCLGGRVQLQGARIEPTWVKLGATARGGDTSVRLDRPVQGWKPGDRLIVTATRMFFERNTTRIQKAHESAETEVRTIAAIQDQGASIVLDKPLEHEHLGADQFRGEVGLLSRNVIIESANPAQGHGHTMFHRDSQVAIAFAELRHLGKEGKLGKYSLHFHKGGETLRGASVVGASIWDSKNRWVTIHGTNGLVIRDCVAFGSVGHGFFLEDGTEVNNVLDHNLAVQATEGKPLPGQVLPFDRNEGAGFWWANSRNAFTRNVAVECDEYGYRYEATPSKAFDPVLNVRDDQGRLIPVDIRTQPFLRFESNEGHTLPRWGFNMGGGSAEQASEGVGRVGPDVRNPFIVKNLKLWGTHWAFTPSAPSLLVDGLDIYASDFGLWRPVFERQAYRGVSIVRCRWFFLEETGAMPDESEFPKPMTPKDLRPPITLITGATALGAGKVRVRGLCIDDGDLKHLRVNGILSPLPKTPAPFADWEVVLEGLPLGRLVVEAAAEDAAGNVEKHGHRLELLVR